MHTEMACHMCDGCDDTDLPYKPAIPGPLLGMLACALSGAVMATALIYGGEALWRVLVA